jgi:hypothetical protein
MPTNPNFAQPPIGGQFISSFDSLVGVQKFQGSKCTGGYPSFPSSFPPNGVPSNGDDAILQFKRAQLFLKDELQDVTQTGAFGRTQRNTVSTDWTCSIDLLWDLLSPPDLILKNGGIIPTLNFNAGFRFWLFLGDDENYPSDSGGAYYFSPRALRGQQVPILDAGPPAKQIGLHIDIVGASGIFKLGSSVDELGVYNAYMANCASWNWYF